MQSPTASNARHSKHGKECPLGPDTDNSTHQLQDQMGPSQVQSHHSLFICNQKQQPPMTSNMRHSKQGQGCPVGSDTDNSTSQLQDQMSPSLVQSHQPSPMYYQSEQPPTASNTRHSKLGQGSPMGPDTNNTVHQLQAQISPGQVQRNCNQPLHYLPQPDTSSNQPQASLQQPDTTFNQQQASPEQPDTSSNEPQALMKLPNTSSSQSQASLRHPLAVANNGTLFFVFPVCF